MAVSYDAQKNCLKLDEFMDEKSTKEEDNS